MRWQNLKVEQKRTFFKQKRTVQLGKMLWLIPAFIKTLLYLFGCPVGGIMSLFSTVIYAVFLLCVIPGYFLFAGPEAAIRFSLLLCVHSLLLTRTPNLVKLIIPMLEVVLFAILLFLPINITPPIAVWFYEKILYASSPILSVFEAIHIVLVIMQVSQMVVDRMDEQPNLAKSVILGVSALAFGLGSFLAYYIYNVYQTHSLNRIIEVLIIICVVLLVLCLVKDEGIISDVPCIYFVMMCVVWALAKESAMAKRQLAPPSIWLRNIPKQLSFFDVLFSMATTGLASFKQIQAIFFHLISPSLLLMAGVRVLSLGYLLRQAMRKFHERSRDSADELESDDDDDDGGDSNVSENSDSSNVFYSRVVVIFVFTELLLRTMFTATSYTHITYPSNTAFKSVEQFEEWWSHTEIVKTFLDFRVWRIVQLCLLVVVYFYKLMVRDGDDDDD